MASVSSWPSRAGSHTANIPKERERAILPARPGAGTGDNSPVCVRLSLFLHTFTATRKSMWHSEPQARGQTFSQLMALFLWVLSCQHKKVPRTGKRSGPSKLLHESKPIGVTKVIYPQLTTMS